MVMVGEAFPLRQPACNPPVHLSRSRLLADLEPETGTCKLALGQVFDLLLDSTGCHLHVGSTALSFLPATAPGGVIHLEWPPPGPARRMLPWLAADHANQIAVSCPS